MGFKARRKKSGLVVWLTLDRFGAYELWSGKKKPVKATEEWDLWRWTQSDAEGRKLYSHECTESELVTALGGDRSKLPRDKPKRYRLKIEDY